MIPFLTYPLALIALASLPALAAIYILRNRFRRRTVSSLVLWHFQVQSKAGGAKVHRLQLPLLFFLELLALALLVMAAAGPHWKLPQSARPLMIILDDSFSMRAVSDGVSAQGRAQAFLEKMYHQSPPPVTRLILAGTETHALGSPVKSWAQVADLLRQWRCPAPGAELDAAITLAAELGKQQANILVLTDHRPVDEHIANPRLEWRAFGARLDNFAIVNASRTALGDQDRCLIEVANFSDHTRSVGVQVRAGTNALSGSNLTLAAQESQRLVFNLPANGQPLRVALPGDALTEDDQVELLPPERRRVRVQVALADADLAALADRTLAATGLRAALSDNPELVIHSGGQQCVEPALGERRGDQRLHRAVCGGHVPSAGGGGGAAGGDLGGRKPHQRARRRARDPGRQHPAARRPRGRAGPPASDAEFQPRAVHAAKHAGLADSVLEHVVVAQCGTAGPAREQRPPGGGGGGENHRRTGDGDGTGRHDPQLPQSRR
jgi:hypothetical protein